MKYLTIIAVFVLHSVLAAAVAVADDGVQSSKATVADVDAGVHPVGTQLTVQVEVVNIEDSDIEIRDVWCTDDVNGMFRWKPRSLPIKILEGGTTLLSVEIDVLEEGAFSTRLVVQTDDDGTPNDTVSAMITVQGKDTTQPPQPTVRFSLSSASANVGEHIGVSLACVQGAAWLQDQGVQEVRSTLRYRRSVLTLDDERYSGSTEGADRVVRVIATGWRGADSILLFPFTACLGDTLLADVVVTDLEFVSDTGIISFDTVLTSTVTILDAWPSADPRHVYRDNNMPALEVFPNPSSGPVTFSLHACSNGATVALFDMQGREVITPYVHTDMDAAHDVHLELDINLPPGVYLCTYTSNNTVVQRPFVLQR